MGKFLDTNSTSKYLSFLCPVREGLPKPYGEHRLTRVARQIQRAAAIVEMVKTSLSSGRERLSHNVIHVAQTDMYHKHLAAVDDHSIRRSEGERILRKVRLNYLRH